MEFDKSKVFTALNADEVELGSKGYYADTIKDLKDIVGQEYGGGYGEIEKITEDCYSSRFKIKNNCCYTLFYLVEDHKEMKLRPYSNPDEMIEDFKRRYNSYGGWSGKDNPMYVPLIWIKSKATGFRHLVTDYGDDDNCGHCNRSCIWIGSISIGFKELLDDFTYLDGMPCGVKND